MYIGIDLGGTKLLIALFDRDFKVVHSVKTKTPGTNDGREIVNLLNENIALLMGEAKVPLTSVEAIGVAVPGAIDIEKGIVLDTPNIGFKDFPLRDLMVKQYQVPVVIENDVNAGVYAEFRRGAAKSFRHVVGIYPGTGIGGGLILDGNLYRGANGSAGEIGHMRMQDGGRLCGCGRYGCLESLASKTSLAKDIVALAATGKAPSIFEAIGADFSKLRSSLIKKSIKAGETQVAELVRRMAHYLGIGMANCVNLFNPQVVILGGGLIEKLAEEIVPVATESMIAHAQPHMVKNVKVVISELGDAAVATGSAILASEARKSK